MNNMLFFESEWPKVCPKCGRTSCDCDRKLVEADEDEYEIEPLEDDAEEYAIDSIFSEEAEKLESMGYDVILDDDNGVLYCKKKLSNGYTAVITNTHPDVENKLYAAIELPEFDSEDTLYEEDVKNLYLHAMNALKTAQVDLASL